MELVEEEHQSEPGEEEQHEESDIQKTDNSVQAEISMLSESVQLEEECQDKQMVEEDIQTDNVEENDQVDSQG